MTPAVSGITGVILAGGMGRRMQGRDKGLVELDGLPMIHWVLARLRPQVDTVLINANRNQDVYAGLGCRVVGDPTGDYRGPLAGMASGMQAAATSFVAVVPCDSPLLPHDLVARLVERQRETGADIVVAHDGERLHPVFCLLRSRLLDSVMEYLGDGERKIDRWFERHAMAVADFSDQADAFRNVNRVEDLAELEHAARRSAAP
jgi:molybdopterin-guanine dinucleotide biosynthesis protein A